MLRGCGAEVLECCRGLRGAAGLRHIAGAANCLQTHNSAVKVQAPSIYAERAHFDRAVAM
ncbi:hypothetical protein GCM10009691_04820 [Brevibacterium picturae]|uniref:Uncharacterized protein n=1 Tax=Brevibacterium picturae TaxID=260553 RepID=A0ABN2B3S0_9MICO